MVLNNHRKEKMGRVALIGENSIGYVNALIDIWNNGDCAVLLDWRIPFPIAVEMMQEAGVCICYMESELFHKMNSVFVSGLSFVLYEKENTAAKLLPGYVYEKYLANYSQNEAVIIYSSGTTGKSKGVILSHYAINTNADAIVDYLKPTASDCMYVVKTMSHASSLVGELLVALKTHTPILIAPIIVPPRYTLSNIDMFKVSIICINPTLLQMYTEEYEKHPNRYVLASLKEIYVHGAKANMALCDLSQKVFRFCSIYYEYGLTEAGPRVATQKISSRGRYSVGKPIGIVEVMIIDDTGHKAFVNEYGSVYVKTPSKYLGYVTGNSKFKSVCDGWLNTGDIGYIDSNNELNIVGRLDDVMIIDAHKIYPSEVETQIIKCSQIKECIVTEVKVEHKSFIGCLYVGEIEIDHSVKKKLRSTLMAYEIPRIFLKCNELPKTITGKVLLTDVKRLLGDYVTHKKHKKHKLG